MRPLSLTLLTIVMGLLTVTAHAEGRIIYTKKSLYRNISVVEDAEKLCMGFATRRRQLKNQSCRLKRYPERLALEYVETVNERAYRVRRHRIAARSAMRRMIGEQHRGDAPHFEAHAL